MVGRKFIIAGLLLVAATGHAKTTPFTAFLKWQGQLTGPAMCSLRVSKNQIYIDAISIDKSHLPQILPFISVLSHPGKTVGRNCGSGTYNLSVQRAGKAERERGCLSSTRFRDLKNACDRLRKYAN